MAGPEATTADPTGAATADPRDSSRSPWPGLGDGRADDQANDQADNRANDRANDRADERKTGPSIPAAPGPAAPTTRSTAAGRAGTGDPHALDDDVPVAPTDTDHAWSPAQASTRPPGRDDGAGPRADRVRRDTPRWLRPVAAVAIAAVALVAFVLGANIGGGDAGDLELQAQLVAPTDDTSAAVTVRKLGSGRDVDVTSDTLPILPDGGIYELWFVGPGDSPDSPNRISAGTFHPDADGTTDVVHAAVVPTDYPTVVITAEPNNGDPAVNGREVVRADG